MATGNPNTAFLPNTRRSRVTTGRSPDEETTTQLLASASAATQTPNLALSSPPPSAAGATAVPFRGSGPESITPPVTAAPVSTSTLSQSDRTRAEAAAKTAASAPTTFQPATPSSGPDVSGLFAPVTQAPTTRPTVTDTSTLAASYGLQNPGVSDPRATGRAPAPQPQPVPVIAGDGARARNEDARFGAGLDDARVVQNDGRRDIYRSEAGVQRRGGAEGYQGSVFEGESLNTSRQLPGLAVPETNDVTRVVTDANGRVVGYARQAASPEAAAAISKAANPNGIQTPELSPIEQKDYERAVAVAKTDSEARQAARGELPSQQPKTELQQWQAAYAKSRGFTPSSDPRDPYQNSPGSQRIRAEEEAGRKDVARTLGIADWNQGRDGSLNAISRAEVALSPGGWSTVGTNQDFRRQQVDRGMNAELPNFLPTEMADRMKARQQAFGDKLQVREAEQNYFEGLSQTPAFERTFGTMNPRQDLRLSDRAMARRIQMAQAS